jgi:hypothetical protein
MEVLQKFLAKNDSGDIVFNIELNNVVSNKRTKLNCTIDIDYEMNPNMKYLIGKLLAAETAPQSKAFIVQEILSSIQTMEPVKNSANENDLTESTEVPNGSEKVMIFMTAQDENEEFASIYEPQNPHYFKDLFNMLAGCLMNLEMIDRSDFETVIAGQSALEEQYVDFYSQTSKFFTTAAIQGNKCYRFFIMQPGESNQYSSLL